MTAQAGFEAMTTLGGALEISLPTARDRDPAESTFEASRRPRR
jgi:hypothetical protein